MSSIKMVALRKHPFGTGEREAGEEYGATADESAILTALGWAEVAGAKQAKPAAPAPAAKPAAKTAGYQRRDMKAKG